jgi:hypothetical protein
MPVHLAHAFGLKPAIVRADRMVACDTLADMHRLHLGIACGLVLACNADQRKCEHARDVVVGWNERDIAEALAPLEDGDEKVRFEDEAKREVNRIRQHFVEQCLALPPEGKGCVARIDELDAAHRKLVADRAACEATKDEHGLPDRACLQAANERAAEALGDCEATIRTLNNPAG